MCTHIHISLILWCLYCYEISSLSFDSDHLHEDEIVSVLQLVEWIVYFIISAFCMYEVMFAYLLSFSFFSYLFICYLLIWNISCFPYLLLHFFGKHMNYTQIHHLLLCHILLTHFIVHNFCSFMRYFQYFSSPFPAVIIMSICTHSHGSAKHWWHSSQPINGNMLTSTKISFVESLCSYDETDVSVISQVTSCSCIDYIMCKHYECDIICCFMWHVFMCTTYIEIVMRHFWANMICVCCVKA